MSDLSLGVDSTYYYLRYPDVLAAGMDARVHYSMYGWTEGRDPHALFSTSQYLLLYPDVKAAGMNPLTHYLTYGQAEGREIRPAEIEPTVTYAFDSDFYLAANPDVAAAGVDPYRHYLTHGWKEGRDPNALFDATGYLAANPDVAASGMEPLTHYFTYGANEGREVIAPPAAPTGIVGTSGNDTLTGTGNSDTINGGAGDDVLNGLGGADDLTGGSGGDKFVFSDRGEGVDIVRDFNGGDGDHFDFDALFIKEGILRPGVPYQPSAYIHYEDITYEGQAAAKVWFDPDAYGPQEPILLAIALGTGFPSPWDY